MNFIKVESKNISLLKKFVSNLGSSSKSFRYFESRNLDSCLLDHQKTILLIDKENPIGYGHLDRDSSDKKLWLGIALSEEFCGKGLGKKIMKELLHDLKEEVYLSVDSNNFAGQKLYTNFGFEILESKSNIIYMKRKNV